MLVTKLVSSFFNSSHFRCEMEKQILGEVHGNCSSWNDTRNSPSVSAAATLCCSLGHPHACTHWNHISPDGQVLCSIRSLEELVVMIKTGGRKEEHGQNPPSQN